MEALSKVGIDSKRTTAASVAIVGVVVYLALVHLKPILMPLAIAVLLFFLIKPVEQYIHKKVGNQFVSYGTVLAAFIISMYFISIFLYEQLSLFVEVPAITEQSKKSEQSMQSPTCTVWYYFSDSTRGMFCLAQQHRGLALAILGSLVPLLAA